MSERHVVDELLKKLSTEFSNLYAENESLRQYIVRLDDKSIASILEDSAEVIQPSVSDPLHQTSSDEAVWEPNQVDFNLPGTSSNEDTSEPTSLPHTTVLLEPTSLPPKKALLEPISLPPKRPALTSSFTRASEQMEYTQKSAFENTEEIKGNVRRLHEVNSGEGKVVMKRSISFKKGSRFTQIVQSKPFEILTLLIIVVNAIWIAIDTDHNDAVVLSEAHWTFQLAEHAFCFFFSVELTLRFLAAKEKCSAWRDPWFVFDSLLVGMMVLETWIMTIAIAAIGGSESLPLQGISILRLFRLARLTRITRLMRSVPELLFMLKGLLEACRSVAVTLTLLVIILYVFSIGLKLLSADTVMGDKYFNSVPDGMFTLLFAGTFLDNATLVVREIGRDSAMCAFVFGLNIVLAAFTMVNMLVGVIVEVVSSVASVERESLSLSFVVTHVKVALQEIDDDSDGCISKDEFHHILEHPKAVKALEAVGVDVIALVDFADFIFQSDAVGKEFDKQVGFQEFMEIIMKLRGDQNSTVKHIIDLQKWMHAQNTSRNMELLKMQHRLRNISRMLDRVTGALKDSIG